LDPIVYRCGDCELDPANLVNNVADKAPPLAVGGDCGSIYCNGNTFGGTYPALGRYLFAQITAQPGRAPAPQ
jgi:hypothetical protein